jgi:hypothetical protein
VDSILSTSISNNKSRWSRTQNPDRLILQPRDREIMAGIYSFRFLTREQVQRLFAFNCVRRVNVRLRKLYDHHYLSRVFLSTTRGSGKAVYFLDPEGAAVVAGELGLDLGVIKNKTKGLSQLKDFFLHHGLELNEVRINLSQAIAYQPEMKLESWINDNDCEQTYKVVLNGKEIARRFRPDGYFRFWYQERLYSFFLELDRSTMTLGRFKQKVQTYLEFARLGFYRQRFGVKYFRVLVIAPSIQRLRNLKKAVEEITNKVFWFTTTSQVTENKAMGQIWQRAGHDGLFPLIDRKSLK